MASIDAPAPVPASGSAHAMAAGALVLACAAAAAIVYFGPGLAEPLLPAFGVSSENYAGMESVFVAVIFGAMLLVGIVAGLAMRSRPLAPGRHAGGALALGIALGLAGVVVAAGYGWLAATLQPAEAPGPSAIGTLLWGLGIIAIQAGTEEVYFRGWLQPVLERAWGALAAILVSAIAFAALHVMGGARAPVTLINLFLGGIMFGVLAWRFGGIAAAVGAHLAWNASEQLLLGLDPNPGVGSFGALFDFDLTGSALWGGSAEGLNASLAMTFALAAIVVPLLIVIRAVPRATRPAATG